MAKTPAAPKPAGDKTNLSPRISLAIDDSGKFALDVMQPKVKDKLKKALADPDLFARLELEKPAGPVPSAAPAAAADPEDAKLTAALVSVIYDALGRAAEAAALARGFTAEQARELLATEAEIQTLTAPTAKIIDKYLPGGFGKYSDELMLAFAIVNVARVKSARMPAAAPPAAAPKAEGNIAEFPSAKTATATSH